MENTASILNLSVVEVGGRQRYDLPCKSKPSIDVIFCRIAKENVCFQLVSHIILTTIIIDPSSQEYFDNPLNEEVSVSDISSPT
jgi:hypothetical protein